MIVPVIIVFALIALLTKKTGDAMSPRIQYTVTEWDLITTPLAIVAGINPAFVSKWNEIESGGNPCAIGAPGAKGPDGAPREMGIGQFYNPDDLVRLKITSSALRAYCAPGTNAVTRQLTPDEMQLQAQALIDLVTICKSQASADLRRVGASWPHEGADYYRLVKLQHALPGISRSGLPATSAFLGRPPTGWREFRNCLASVTLDPGTEKYREDFDRILNNAELCGSVVKDPGVV